MNWYKTAQQKPWELSEKDYTGGWQDSFVDDDAGYKAYRDKRQEWRRETTRAVGRGDLDIDTAYQRGWYPQGAGNRDNVKPLPQQLFHVTTAKDAVLRDQLKSREELSMDDGHGLGGGDNETISFTTDLKIARDIKEALLEGRMVARGEVSIDEMIKRARAGSDANQPYLREWFAYWNFDPANGVPQGLDDLRRGLFRVNTMMPQTLEQFVKSRQGDALLGWKGTKRWPHGEQPLFTEFMRRLIPAEIANKTFDVYKSWAMYREAAGGPMNPLFFGSNVEALAAVPEDQIAILEYRAKPNAMGY